MSAVTRALAQEAAELLARALDLRARALARGCGADSVDGWLKAFADATSGLDVYIRTDPHRAVRRLAEATRELRLAEQLEGEFAAHGGAH